MADVVREVTRKSWGGRLGESFKGILFGLIMFAGSFVLLFWNEGRAVRDMKGIAEGRKACVAADSGKVVAELEGRLVHMTGKADTRDMLTDPIFNVPAQALRLRRQVEMYQWSEHKSEKTEKTLGGGEETVTTYTYEKQWSDRLISSGSFHTPSGHENPAAMPYPSETWQSENISFGAFKLSPGLAQQMRDYRNLPVGPEVNIPVAHKAKAKPTGQYLYIGDNPGAPVVGDARITFQAVYPAEVSIISRQVSNTFEPYIAQSGKSLDLLEMGTKSAQIMFDNEESASKTMTWILRLVGFIVMGMGLAAVLKPLSVVADVLPLLGNLVEAGTSLVAFLVAAVLSLTTIALAWLVYRPLLGIGLLAVAGGIAFVVRKKLQTKAT